MPIIIKRHCVANHPTTQLSPLQTELLNRPEKVRIADAPTGAGKSYAFQRAMLDSEEGKRILFIVPTRRLAQNLIRGLAEDLEKAGWSSAKIQTKIALWTSDKTKQLQEEGVKEIGVRRVREVYELDTTRSGGEMIVAIPEVVSYILLRDPRSIKSGQSDTGIFDFLTCFDHIVFDEFHTITARGFGLAAVFAKLAAEMDAYRAQISFLSATPLEIQPVLAKLEVPETQIALLRETISDTGRIIHGDVTLCFEETATLADLLAHHVETLQAEIAKNRQIVIIYNSLADLQQQLVQLEQTIQQANIAPQDCLLINSLDDSRPEITTARAFMVGRTQSPEKFKVLIATSSVEMGVTFAADVLFMEPGFEPLNFLQRYGRAARGDYDGQVIVRIDDAIKKNQPWVRQLMHWVEQHDGQTIPIQALTEQLSQAVMKEFKTPITEKTAYFGKLPSRAAYTAGLYWQALTKHRSNQGHRAEQLKHYAPKPAKIIYILLAQVRQMEKNKQFGQAAKNWCDRFEEEVKILRDIGRSIRVIEGNGHGFTARILWLQRFAPEILNTGYWTTGDDGCEEIRINGYLRITEDKQYVPEQATVGFPHTQLTALLKTDNELVKNWCRLLRDSSGPESIAWELFPEAMKAAEELVQKTGLIVTNEDDLSLEAETGVW
jgi:CRISPR-associated helicase Cas3